MTPRAHVRSVASGLLDDRARNLGEQVEAGELTRDAAAAKILVAAVNSGVVASMCRRHYQRLADVWGSDEVCSAVTTMLVRYALGSPDRDGNLDPARFADGAASAAGWIGKVIGAMRTTRILREMSVETRELAVPSVLERASAASAEDDVLAAVVPEIDETTRGMPATSATLRMVHASALHQLLGLPPLQPWCLTREQQNGVLDALERHPEQVSRILRGDRGGTSGAVAKAVKVLWAGWSRDDAPIRGRRRSPSGGPRCAGGCIRGR